MKYPKRRPTVTAMNITWFTSATYRRSGPTRTFDIFRQTDQIQNDYVHITDDFLGDSTNR